MSGYDKSVKEEVRERYIEIAREVSKTESSASNIAQRAGKKLNREYEDIPARSLRRWTKEYRDDGRYVGPVSESEDSEESSDAKSRNLSEKEKQLIYHLPAQKSELVDELGIEEYHFDHLLNQLEEQGVNVEYDEDADCYFLPDQPQKRRLSTKAKGSITKEANKFRTEQEAAVLRRLKGKEPLREKPDPTPGNEDIVVAMGDTHFGDVVEDETGHEVYNPRVAAASVHWLTRKVLQLKKLQEDITNFDTCHLVWPGDMLTSEGIYDGQAYDIELLLADQLSLTVETLLWQATTLAEHFDHLQIVAVPGNHGRIRSSSTSGQANMDLVAYRWVTDRLIDRGYDNINFLVGEAKHYRNFELRGGEWRLGVRHGHDEKIHVDATAASQGEQRGLIERHDVDGFVRGHHHTHRHEEILNEYPVITVPSPKPGGEYAEKIRRPDCSSKRKLGVFWRCSDSRLITAYYVVDDVRMDVSDMDVPTIEDIRKRSM